MFNTYNRRKLNRQAILRAVNDIRNSARDPRAGSQTTILHAARELRRLLGGANAALDSSLNDIVRLAEHAVKLRASGWVENMAKELERKGNPAGYVIGAAMRARRDGAFAQQMEQKLTAADRMLRQVAPELYGAPAPEPPKESREKQAPARQKDPKKDQPKPEAKNENMPQGIKSLGNGFVRVDGPGFMRFYRENDPTLTGRMIPVTSSNVHSIGFRINLRDPARGSSLIVRYLQPDGGHGPGQRSTSKVAGPTYRYDGVHPDIFKRFREAISKGEFVWDNLRVRGTIYGHRYKYTLESVAQGYVPRRITKIGNNIMYKGRENAGLVNGRVQIMRSQLPDQIIRRARPSDGRPNNGRPNNGR